VSGAELIARGDPAAPGVPSELVVLGVFVAGFFVLIGAIVFALRFAKRRHPETQAYAEKEERDHVAFVRDLKTGEQSSPGLRLPPELSEGARLTRRERRCDS
jgi:H+/gluconate symporter-like permease